MHCFIRFCVAWSLFSVGIVSAEDWARFRGPAGSGVASDSDVLPDAWSPTANLAWKTPLPGPGASSPIIVGDRVLVTCYSGYGISRQRQGSVENLVRHLVCLNLKTGEEIWRRDVPAWLPEDSYYESGVSSHGYASHTPVSDGRNVYAFFGKGGVHAFDLNGSPLWQADVGKESDPPRWGSSSSPVLWKNTLIITAAAESQSLIGFDKETGKKIWHHPATGLDGMWGTPALVQVNHERTDLVMLVAKELWGIDPETGRMRWYVDATDSGQAYTSVISKKNRVFAFSGGGSLALDLSGSSKTRETDVVWTSPIGATYSSPVRYQDRLHVVSRDVLTVLDADTGDRLQQVRMRGAKKVGNARFGALDYASPVIAGDRLFHLNASGQVYVFALGDKVELVSINEATTDQEIFWGSPAISAGRILLRSSRHLYCLADQGDKVTSGQATEDAEQSSNEFVNPQGDSGTPRRRRARGNRDAKPNPDPRPPRPRRPPPAGS